MAQRAHGLGSRLVHHVHRPESAHTTLRQLAQLPHSRFASFPPPPDLLENKPTVPTDDQVRFLRPASLLSQDGKHILKSCDEGPVLRLVIGPWAEFPPLDPRRTALPSRDDPEGAIRGPRVPPAPSVEEKPPWFFRLSRHFRRPNHC